MLTDRLRSRTPRFGRAGRAWTVAWLGGSLIGIANGTIRELTYRRRVGELKAHQISSATALAAFVLYMWRLNRRFPITDRDQAVAIGAAWVGMTIVFELGFGHWVDHKRWDELLEQYDMSSGHVWPLVLAWLGLGPAVVSKLQGTRM